MLTGLRHPHIVRSNEAFVTETHMVPFAVKGVGLSFITLIYKFNLLLMHTMMKNCCWPGHCFGILQCWELGAAAQVCHGLLIPGSQ